MKESDDLYRLIHSMSKQEKRHFRLFAGASYTRAGGNNYLRLFDAIEKQKAYDEKKIKEKFKGETFILHYPSEKKYLESIIHRTLRNYHSKTNTDVQVKELLIDAEVLFERSLNDLCRKALKKAKELCYRHERLTFIPEITRLESRLLDLQHLDEIYKEEQYTLKNIYVINRYRILSNKVAKLVANAHHLRKKTEWKELERIMRDPLLRNEECAVTFTAKIYYFYIKGVFFELKGDLHSAYSLRKRFVEVTESDKTRMKTQARNYLSALNNLVISQMELKKFAEAQETVEKIRSVPLWPGLQKKEDILISSYVFASILQMNIFIRTGEFEKGISSAKEAEHLLRKYEGRIHPQFAIVIRNSIKYIYFGTDEFKKALRWSNSVMDDKTDVRHDIKAMSRIFNLILHFELGNTDLMEYIIPSTYRFLMKSQRLFKVETIVLNYLRRSAHIGNKKEIVSSFRKLHRELLPLAKDPYEKKAFEEFDLLAWLESKIQGRSFASVIKSKRGEIDTKE